MLLSAITISLICIAVHMVTREGYLMDWVRVATCTWPGFITKPLYDCLLCMGGIWGLTGALIAGYTDAVSLNLIPLMVLGMNGIATILLGIYGLLEIIARHSKDAD